MPASLIDIAGGHDVCKADTEFNTVCRRGNLLRITQRTNAFGGDSVCRQVDNPENHHVREHNLQRARDDRGDDPRS